ncbi:kinase-like domain-containing protein [Rhodocollybia butyracea]|uniref:Kinase-like domain-containing protein n=1 Tax=Rhodocollybia butyracea TaxID=206335 RepID=A0A9P5TYE6_9AGAR|nr:kinase-like domain-containing protein [Rhodocollybia butyracea]
MGSDYHCKAKQDIRLITDPLQESDLKDLAELGMGNGGSVMKVEHVPSGIVMAKKIVLIDAKPTIRKQILRELHIMHACSSPYIVSSFGAFLSEPNICICMEFMDRGSFESIYKNIGRKIKLKGPRSSLLRANTWDSGDTEQVPGPIPIGIVRQVARCVLGGLVYLYEDMGVLHRDIKPSNILLNSEGQVKLCDFGVSGELENSVAKTFVGTSVYMSPERILGSDYTVKSDVWSLGVTLIELAHGCFPFSDTDEGESPLKSVSSATLPSALSKRASSRKSRRISVHTGVGSLSILELMHHIVQEPPPTLITPSVQHSLTTEADEFVGNCLKKDPVSRLNPRELLGTSWMDNDRTRKEMDLRTWAGTL